MTAIFVKDRLRATVEAATGGQTTVLYTESGEPSFFFVLPKFNLEDIDPSLGSGPHPAFIIDGREVSRLFIGQYRGIKVPVSGGYELLSLPRVKSPYYWLDYVTSTPPYSFGCPPINNGPGYHIMTNAEWAAVALWCQKNNTEPHGNTGDGSYEGAPFEHGVVWNPYNEVLTGSGPATWRHNHAHTGISDMVGKFGEITAGLRIVEGEIQVCENNDAAAWQSGPYNAKPWKAILLATGALVVPGTAGTVKVDSVLASSGSLGEPHGDFVFSSTRTNSLEALNQSNRMSFSEVDSALARLKVLLLAPLATGVQGWVNVRNFGTSYAARGGDVLHNLGWAGDVGLGTLDLSYTMGSMASLRIAKY